MTSSNTLTEERDQLQKEIELLKNPLVEKGESNCLMTVLFDSLCISSHVTYKQEIQLTLNKNVRKKTMTIS